MKIVTFPQKKKITPQNGLLVFLGKETHSETKSWNSSRISTNKVTTTTVNPGNRRGFCEGSQISSLCLSFFIIFSIFSFFHFSSFSHFFILFHFPSFVFHFSFIFFHFLSFSIMYYHFLSFSFRGGSLNFVTISCDISFKKINVSARLGGYHPFEASFPSLFLPFFHSFFFVLSFF